MEVQEEELTSSQNVPRSLRSLRTGPTISSSRVPGLTLALT